MFLFVTLIRGIFPKKENQFLSILDGSIEFVVDFKHFMFGFLKRFFSFFGVSKKFLHIPLKLINLVIFVSHRIFGFFVSNQGLVNHISLDKFFQLNIISANLRSFLGIQHHDQSPESIWHDDHMGFLSIFARRKSFFANALHGICKFLEKLGSPLSICFIIQNEEI